MCGACAEEVASGRGKAATRRGTLGRDEYRNFLRRRLSVFPLLDPRPPAASLRPGSKTTSSVGSARKPAMLHIPPMKQLAEPGRARDTGRGRDRSHDPIRHLRPGGTRRCRPYRRSGFHSGSARCAARDRGGASDAAENGPRGTHGGFLGSPPGDGVERDGGAAGSARNDTRWRSWWWNEEPGMTLLVVGDTKEQQRAMSSAAPCGATIGGRPGSYAGTGEGAGGAETISG
jgi:hypothetical protein